MTKYQTELHKLIADLYVLRSMTQTIHWNYQGQNFIEFHKWLDDVKDTAIDPFIDELAEDLVKNDMFVHNPLHLVSTYSSTPKVIDEQDIMILDYYELLTSIDNRLTVNTSGDFSEVTKDIFIRLSTEITKTMWFIKATFKIQS